MKKTITTLVLAAITVVSTSAFMQFSKNGIQGYTGSPGEATCNLPTCHGAGTGAVNGTTISAVPSFTDNEFIPGTAYVITIDLQAAGYNAYGFGCEILDASNVNAGTMANAGAGVKFLNAGSRKNAVHTAFKSGTGGTSFSFGWTAPTVGDTATIYVAGNAVNADGSRFGDSPMTPTLMQLKAHVDPDVTGLKENADKTLKGMSVHPNPTSGLTTLSYNLAQQQEISVQLVDIRGKVIKEFFNETQAAGSYTRFLDLHGVDAGVYFVKTNVKGQGSQQKLIAVQ